LHLISSSLDSVQPSQALVSRPSQAKKAALEDGQKDSWSMTHGPHLQIHLTKDGPCSLQHGAFFLVLPFYAYYGITYTGWTDPGVYSVSISLIAFGFALKALRNAPAGDETLN
jgi:hypothetical protein